MKEHYTVSAFFADRSIPLAIHRRSAQRPKTLHTHAFSELVLVLGGKAVHFTNDDEHTIQQGDIFIIQGDLAHGYRDSKELSIINIMYEWNRLHLPESGLHSMPGFHALFTLEPQYRRRHRFASRLHLNAEQLKLATAIAGQIEGEMHAKKPGYAFISTAFFMQLIAFLARCYDGEQAPESKLLLRIGAVISYLEVHYKETTTAKRLTEIAGMSESSLLRAFKVATGTTPLKYLIRLRIRHACTLLLRTDLNITEIAFQTGFSDSNYFTRQFRQTMNQSARQYRRERRG